MKKSTSAPVLRPIQLRCSVLMLVGPIDLLEIVFQPVGIGRDPQHPLPQRQRTTGWPPRSLMPPITSSLASTVPNAGHQFTGASS